MVCMVPQQANRDTSLGDGGPMDGNMIETMCTDNWKAARAETTKISYKEFEQSGIFISACRHGFILFLTDMIHSGEL